MNFKIRKSNGKWRAMQGLDDLVFALDQLSPADTLEVKQVCEHKNTWVGNGIRRCKDCWEELEVTSYRD